MVAPVDCPFCGSSGAIDALISRSGTQNKFRVQCRGCACATKWHDTEAEARAAWNVRAVPENIFINKDLFYHRGLMFARNPQTDYCYIGGADGKYRRIKRQDYLLVYAECAKATEKDRKYGG